MNKNPTLNKTKAFKMTEQILTCTGKQDRQERFL